MKTTKQLDKLTLAMVDNETFSRKPNGLVWETGICFQDSMGERLSMTFQFLTKQLIEDLKLWTEGWKFEMSVFDFEECTYKWWAEENPKRKMYFEKYLKFEEKLLMQIKHRASKYSSADDYNYNQCKKIIREFKMRNIGFVIANSPAFDLCQLKNLFAFYELETPWEYNQELDYRTVRKLAEMKGFDGHAYYVPKHTGQSDAMAQMNFFNDMASLLVSNKPKWMMDKLVHRNPPSASEVKEFYRPELQMYDDKIDDAEKE